MAPDLPLMTKDIPSLNINNWFGLVGPAGLPPDIAAASPSCSSRRSPIPPTRRRSTSAGLEALGQDGPAFASDILKDRERWAKVVKAGQYPQRQ